MSLSLVRPRLLLFFFGLPDVLPTGHNFPSNEVYQHAAVLWWWWWGSEVLPVSYRSAPPRHWFPFKAVEFAAETTNPMEVQAELLVLIP